MSDDFNHYQYNNTRIEYKCPSGTEDKNDWQDIDYEHDALDLGAKKAEGPSCTASLTFTGTGAMVGGAIGAHFHTWGCSIDGGETYQWYHDPDPPMTKFAVICNFLGMEEKEHTLVVSNSPGGGTALRVSSFSVTTGGLSLGTTLSPVNFSTTAQPEPVSTTSSSSTITSSSSAFSSSSLASTSAHAGTTVAETNSQSTSLSTTISSPSGSSSAIGSGGNLTYILITVVVVAIVVLCLVAALCLRTKPKSGREEAGGLLGRESDDDRSLRKEGGGSGARKKARRKRASSPSSGSSSASSSGSDDEEKATGRRYRQLGRAAPPSLRRADSPGGFW